MKIYKFVQPAILSLMLPFACAANAMEPQGEPPLEIKDYYYVTIKGGVDQPTKLGGSSHMNTGDATYTGGIAAGTKFFDIFGAEAEYTHAGKRKYNNTSAGVAGSPQSASSWGVTSDSLMVNLSADLFSEGKIIPYVKAGLGVSRNKTDRYVFTTSSNNYTYAGKTATSFAWQVGAGLNLASSMLFDTQIQYMFTNHGTIKTASGYTQTPSIGNSITSAPAITGRLRDHVITVGITVRF